MRKTRQPSMSESTRYNVIGPKIPEHLIKETRVVYINDEYRDQIQMQLEKRSQRIEQGGSTQ